LPSSELTYNQVKDAAKKIDDDVPKIIEQIESEFRILVGVIEEK